MKLWLSAMALLLVFESVEASEGKSVILNSESVLIKVFNAEHSWNCRYLKPGPFQEGGWFAGLGIDQSGDQNLGFKNYDTELSKTHMGLWGLKNDWRPTAKCQKEKVFFGTLPVSVRGYTNFKAKREVMLQTSSYNWILVERISFPLSGLLDQDGKEVVISKSLYVDLGVKKIFNITGLEDIVGMGAGTLFAHPQAASSEGLNCVMRKQIYDQFLNLNIGAGIPQGVVGLRFRSHINSFPAYPESPRDLNCSLELERLISLSRSVDPSNRGELLPVTQAIFLKKDKNGANTLVVKQNIELHQEKFVGLAEIVL